MQHIHLVGVHPDQHKNSDLEAMSEPPCKKRTAIISWILDIDVDFLKNLAEKLAPLKDIIKKKSLSMWEIHHQKCIQNLKEAVLDHACLSTLTKA